MMRCDTAAAAEVAPALAGTAGLPPLAGIMNSGGMLRDGMLGTQTAASVRIAHGPKLASAAAMQRGAAAQPVHHQLLFSSVASLLGSAGQANYAAANAALEGWAARNCDSGLNDMAVQWGAWAAGTHGRGFGLLGLLTR